LLITESVAGKVSLIKSEFELISIDKRLQLERLSQQFNEHQNMEGAERGGGRLERWTEAD
jgi:hypothetical protein